MPSFSRLFRIGRSPEGGGVDGAAELARFSNLTSTAYKRHIQTLHESGDRRNPDLLAGALLTAEQRERCLRLKPELLQAMRNDPYYYFLAARTRFHDQALLDAVAAGIRRVMVMGSGFDTRLYRFGASLANQGVSVAECDQPEAIVAKRDLAAQLPFAARVCYLGVNLNDPQTYEPMLGWLAAEASPVLIIAEGVSPYIDELRFVALLELLHLRCQAFSRFNYDFKLAGVADEFGKGLGTAKPFRFVFDAEAIAGMHAALGYHRTELTNAAALMKVQIPSWTDQISPLFRRA